jgi:hypothetical protein
METECCVCRDDEADVNRANSCRSSGGGLERSGRDLTAPEEGRPEGYVARAFLGGGVRERPRIVRD